MGYNTTVLILNDALSVLQEHPQQFVDGIIKHLMSGGDVSVGNHVNPAHVMPTDHADTFRLYCTQGNAITELSGWNSDTIRMATSEHEYLRDCIQGLIDQAEDQIRHLKKAIRDASSS